MKEGDVMKEKNVFDVLENTDTSVIDRLAAEFPPQDNGSVSMSHAFSSALESSKRKPVCEPPANIDMDDRKQPAVLRKYGRTINLSSENL